MTGTEKTQCKGKTKMFCQCLQLFFAFLQVLASTELIFQCSTLFGKHPQVINITLFIILAS